MNYREPLTVGHQIGSEETRPERMLSLMRATLRSQRMREALRDRNATHSEPAKKVACS